ncbi:MAG TPA: hypothetical protein PKZ92_02570 [Candidatus Woesebacteria bacterium]|jgi:hypothetical protein|nr:hypothetical protein [Candidatus Shapirobacteria bacterium]HOR02119.1 hypothetical protein [Candidatus Woesebacteria bacterium]
MGEFGKNNELFLRQETTIAQIKSEKEKIDLNARIEGLKSVIRSDTTVFYEGCLLEKRYGREDQIDLGDYGSTSNYVNNYFLNLFFECGGYKSEEGEPLTVDSLIRDVKRSGDLRPILVYEGKDNSSAEFYSFAGKNNDAFHSLLVNVSDNLRGEMIAKFYETPAIGWVKTINEAISQQKDLVVMSQGVYKIAPEELQGIEVGKELELFVKMLGLVPVEKEIKIDSKDEVTNESGEGNYMVIKTNKDKVAFLIEPQDGGIDEKKVNISVCLDIEKMSGRSETDRFVTSKTAEEIMDLLDKAGVKVSDQVLNYISEGSLNRGKVNPEFSPRYGNGYAELTRLISYGIGLQDREEIINRLFSKFDESGWEKTKTERDKLGGPSKLVFEMIDDLIDPERNQKKSDYDFFKSNFSVRDGSCKDIEFYYEMALERGKFKEDNDFFYQETYGARPSAITRREIMVGGVRLPKGFLCRVSEEGVEPLRPTMFCFSKEEAIDAYGKQYWDIYENNSKKLGRLIEMSNQGLIF